MEIDKSCTYIAPSLNKNKVKMSHSFETIFSQYELAYCQLLRQGVKSTDMYIHGDGNGLSIRAHNYEEAHGSLFVQLCHEDVEMFAMRYALAHDEIDEIAIANTENALTHYRK